MVAAFVSDCKRKAVLVEANCETDFVAKSELFMKYVNNFCLRLLEKDSPIDIQQEDEQLRKESVEKLLQEEKSLKVFP